MHPLLDIPLDPGSWNSLLRASAPDMEVISHSGSNFIPEAMPEGRQHNTCNALRVFELDRPSRGNSSNQGNWRLYGNCYTDFSHRMLILRVNSSGGEDASAESTLPWIEGFLSRSYLSRQCNVNSPSNHFLTADGCVPSQITSAGSSLEEVRDAEPFG